MKILWLTSRKTLMENSVKRHVIGETLKEHGFDADTYLRWGSLHTRVPTLADAEKERQKKGNKGKRKMPPGQAIAQAQEHLAALIKEMKPTVICTDDEPTIHVVSGKPYAQMTVAGSVYEFQGIPIVCVNQFGITRFKKSGHFVYNMHLAKLIRYATNTLRPEPPFKLTVCASSGEVAAHVAEAKKAALCAVDIETRHGFITSVAYTYDTSTGSLATFVVPFFHPLRETGEYWPGAVELQVRALLFDLHISKVDKVTQNGTYDQAYFIKQLMPLTNWFVDTQYLMHSMFAEADKDLASMAALFVDRVRYWKDDNKGVKDDTFGRNQRDLDVYWRYNGLDTYYTYLVAKQQLRHIVGQPWALRNYSENFALAVGPYFAAGMRGIKVHEARHAQIINKYSKAAAMSAAAVRRLVDEPEFNPSSPFDCAWALYDLYQAKTTRLQKIGSKYGPRSTDEKVLRLVKEQQNVLTNHFINRLLAAKKPANIVSNFGELRHISGNGRFGYSLAPTTETARCRSSNSPFWFGRNVQNVQALLREFCVADDDYVLVDIDFSASDDHFIAYESEDPVKMDLVESDKDPHCYHASIFFSRDYDSVVAGWRGKEAWCIAEPTGIRQIAKKIAHGRNFKMGATMMYNLMGRDAVVATATALGRDNAIEMTDKELIGVCAGLVDKYDHPKTGMYRRIRPWQDEAAAACAENGGLASAAFGFTRKFFGDPRTNHKVARELAAFYGQGGTAGNINRVVYDIFYKHRLDDGKSVLLLAQVHDSLVFLIHKSRLAVIDTILEIMAEKVVIKGRPMNVPAAAEIGLTWGKNMMPWKTGTTYQEIRDFEDRTFGKKYVDELMAALASLQFDLQALPQFDQRLLLEIEGDEPGDEAQETEELMEDLDLLDEL